MVSTPDRNALKEQALLTLEQSRNGMSRGMKHVREEFSPKRILQQNVQKYPKVMLVGAAGLGFILMRTLLPSRENKRDTTVKTAKKRTLTALLFSGIWGIARGPLLGFASQQLTPLLMQQISRYQPQPPNKPESFE